MGAQLRTTHAMVGDRRDMRRTLARLWWAGVDAVRGDRCTAAALRDQRIARPDGVIAVGKAAAAMAEAAAEAFGTGTRSLIVTKHGHTAGHVVPGSSTVIEAGHPVPDANSLEAGAALARFVGEMDAGSHLLVLVSGGASALAELPVDGGLEALATENARMLAAGWDIHRMNAHRITLSQIKGGKLLSRFGGAKISVLAMSDVEGDEIGVIGSGIGSVPKDAQFTHETHIIASNAIARAAVADAATEEGLSVIESDECLYCDVRDAAAEVARRVLAKPAGLAIFGGEPTVLLPANPGRGGRNQALALELARAISGRDDIVGLVAGTDGSDGPTGDAGGFADGTLWGDGADEALTGADAGSYLAGHGALFTTGPTGTNVMDLALVAIGSGRP
ncbi:MAG: DUF4147 domain-containing protein [Pseudomonadota bacterium]